jgi:hypothetical protein
MSLLPIIGSGESGGFYNGVATQSLRIDNSASALLHRTPSAGDRKKWAWSAWIKRCDTGRTQDLFTAEGSGDQLFAIQLIGTDQIQIYGADAVLLVSNQILRDLSSWYHILVASDTTQTTASNRLKLYVNGSEVTSFATDARSSYAQDTDYGVNSNVKHNIGSNQAGGNFGDYYIAEVNFIDGLSFFSNTSGAANSSFNINSFGETKNGVWIPIEYSGSYGTQGFHLEFKETGDGSSTASSSTIGADTANSNHYKDTNLDAYDSNMPDSPENNFCTLNPLENDEKFANTNQALMTHSEGNLKFSGGRNVFGNIGVNSGKWYWEVINTSSTETSVSVSGVVTHGARADHYAVYYNRNGNKGIGLMASGATESSYGATYTDDNIIGVALNMDDNQVTFFKDNADQGTITDANLATGDVHAWTQNGANSGTLVGVYNWGQDGSFAGSLTGDAIGDATDGNGHGKFKYAPPSGFLALCTANLPELTIGPNSGTDEQAANYFDVFKYTGNGSDNHDVPDQTAATSVSNQGLGFKPDMVFTLRNDGGFHKFLTDSTRGGDKGFFVTSNSTHNVDASAIKAFNAPTDSNPATNGGYRLGTSTNFNVNTKDYFSPCWKVNGSTTSTNDDGSIDSTVQVNTTAGISIVQATSPSSGTWTVGHGLGVKPKWIILKYIASNSRFTVFFDGFTSGQYLELNGTGGVASAGTPFNFTVTDTLIGGNADYDTTSTVAMYYCFAEIEGFSKIGTFTGNVSTDGTYVHTGFRPQMIIAKSQGSGNWHTVSPVFDHEPTNENVPLNPLGYFNLSDTASSTGNYQNFSHYDFLSNGFKLRDNGSESNARGTFNYYAVATAPFKYSNAV